MRLGVFAKRRCDDGRIGGANVRIERGGRWPFLEVRAGEMDQRSNADFSFLIPSAALDPTFRMAANRDWVLALDCSKNRLDSIHLSRGRRLPDCRRAFVHEFVGARAIRWHLLVFN